MGKGYTQRCFSGGLVQGSRDHVQVELGGWTAQLGLWEEDMSYGIDEIAPFKWKVQHPRGRLHGITKCSQTHPRRSKSGCARTKEQFQEFLKRHEEQACLVPEDNDAMESSSLLLNESMRSAISPCSSAAAHIHRLDSSTAKAGKRCSEKASSKSASTTP
jgi:hypothetical protein